MGNSKSLAELERWATILAQGNPRRSRSEPFLWMISSIAGRVHCMWHWLKMGGIDAGGNFTQMVKNQAIRNGTDQQFVGEAMGESYFVVRPELPVSATDQGPSPEPAARNRWPNHSPESCFWRSASVMPGLYDGAVVLPSRIMRTAPASTYGFALASLIRTLHFPILPVVEIPEVP